MNENQDAFEDKVKQHLNDSVEQLDAATLSRLNQARQQAQVKKPQFFMSIWTAGITAATACIFMVFILFPISSTIQTGLNDPLAYIALFEQDEIELYEELDFYQWLDQQHG